MLVELPRRHSGESRNPVNERDLWSLMFKLDPVIRPEDDWE